MDAVVFNADVRLELTPAPYPWPGGPRRTVPTWRARLLGEGLDALLLCPESEYEPPSLTDFLTAIDQDWRGWEGERVWKSEDALLTLGASHDRKSAVLLSVVLEDGAPPRWRCEADLELEPGTFRQLAADAYRLGEASLALRADE